MKFIFAGVIFLSLVTSSLNALTFNNKSNAKVHFSVTLIHPKATGKADQWLGYVFVPAHGQVVKHFDQLALLPSSYTVKAIEGGYNLADYYVMGGTEFVCGQHAMGFGDINKKTFTYQNGKCTSK